MYFTYNSLEIWKRDRDVDFIDRFNPLYLLNKTMVCTGNFSDNCSATSSNP